MGCWCEDTCDKLCDECEEYTDQDYVGRDPQHIAYVSPNSLGYLAESQTLDLAEMQTDVRLGMTEWHYVKKAKLTDQQMQVVWLYYWEKMTQTQIGKKLGVTQQTVHQHLEYAKKKLIKLLKPE
jgi:DNA-directed RNA polymerase sigma subunit (sigma70/sigma32)